MEVLLKLPITITLLIVTPIFELFYDTYTNISTLLLTRNKDDEKIVEFIEEHQENKLRNGWDIINKFSKLMNIIFSAIIFLITNQTTLRIRV